MSVVLFLYIYTVLHPVGIIFPLVYTFIYFSSLMLELACCCKYAFRLTLSCIILGADVLFPKTYPISCLLGCVDVVDVLPYEEYLQQVIP